MKKLISTIVLTIVLLSSCSTVLKSTEDLANIAIAHEQVASGQVANTIKSIDLNSTEVLIVDHAINHYIAFSDKWKQKVSILDSTSPIFTEFLSDYDNLVKQYKSVEGIITANWARYPTRYQIILEDYNVRANKINQSIDKLIVASRRYQAITTAIELAAILAGSTLR